LVFLFLFFAPPKSKKKNKQKLKRKKKKKEEKRKNFSLVRTIFSMYKKAQKLKTQREANQKSKSKTR